jgi:thiosulfate sulfurtransferase
MFRKSHNILYKQLLNEISFLLARPLQWMNHHSLKQLNASEVLVLSYQDICAEQVESFFEQRKPIVIDARDIDSFKAGHLKNALYNGGPALGHIIRQRKHNPTVLVYCYHGNLSRSVAEMISELGLSNVYNLEGGWQAWLDYQSRKPANQRPLFRERLADAF